MDASLEDAACHLMAIKVNFLNWDKFVEYRSPIRFVVFEDFRGQVRRYEKNQIK